MNLIALLVGGVFLLVLISGSANQRVNQRVTHAKGGRLAGGVAFLILVPVILLLALGAYTSARTLADAPQPSAQISGSYRPAEARVAAPFVVEPQPNIEQVAAVAS